MEINKQLNEILKEIPVIENLQDAWYILCKLSFVFEKGNIDVSIFEENALVFLDILKAVFENKIFYEQIEKSTLEYNKYRENKENEDFNETTKVKKEDEELINTRKLILLFLEIAFFCPVLFLEYLDKSFVKKLRFILIDLNKDIEYFADYKFSYENIIMGFVSITYDKNYQFNDMFPLKRIGVKMGSQINDKFLFANNKNIISIIIVTFVSMPYLKFISKCLNKKSKHIADRLSKVYGVSAVAENRIKHQLQRHLDNIGDNKILNKYINDFRTSNEKIIGFILDRITSGFFYEEKITFDEKLKKKLTEIPKIKGEIIDFCKKTLTAFNSNLDINNNERANKVFLVTMELLSVLEIMLQAKDWGWIRNSTVRSLNIRLEKINEIINKYELIDDRDQIKDCLVEENDIVEWKTNFFTPTETKFVDSEQEKKIGEDIFFGIIKSIIGMMNTNGGNIIIGLCEHPEKIVRENIIHNTIKKNGYVFYDVNKEINEKKRDADMLKRYIQEKLKNETKLDIDKTDKYWKIISLKLIDEKNIEKNVVIFKITVEKVETPIFCVNEKQNRSISLLKRVDGRTIFVDPRDYL